MASKTLNLQLHCLQAISGIIDQALDLEQSLQDILRILAEAHYLESTRSLRLTPPLLHPEAQRYLKFRSEAAVLAALELTH